MLTAESPAMNRRNWKIYVVIILTLLSFTANMCASGFYFITNQYIYYRFSDDAGLPYPPVQTNSSCDMGNTTMDPDRDKRAEVQAKAARLLSVIGLVSLVSGIFSSIIVGRLSDQHGRRLAIGVVLLGQGLFHGTVAIMVFLHLPVYLAILGSFFSGLFGGGMISFIMQVSVCLTDVTATSIDTKAELSPDELSKRTRQERRRLFLLGAFDATMILGSAITNSFIGSVVENYGFIESELCMLGIFCLVIILIWILPETGKGYSIPPSQPALNDDTTISISVPTVGRSSVCPRPGEWCARLRAMLNSIASILSTRNPMSVLALLLIFLMNLVVQPEGNYFFLYLMAKPFCWSPEQIGLYNGLVSLLMALLTFCLAGITACSMKTKPPVMTAPIESPEQVSSPLLSTSEEDSSVKSNADRAHQRQILCNRLRMIFYVLVSFLTLAITRTMLGLAFLLPRPSCSALVLLALILNLVRSSLLPTLKSFVSSLHDSRKQGQLFSVIGVCEYVSQLVGLPTLPAVYAFTVALFPGAVFLLSAGVSSVSALLTCVLLHYIFKEMRATRDNSIAGTTRP